LRLEEDAMKNRPGAQEWFDALRVGEERLSAVAVFTVAPVLKVETLELEFPGYLYGKAQWVAAGLAERPLHLVFHRIAGT
jgi:hypothetical protein